MVVDQLRAQFSTFHIDNENTKLYTIDDNLIISRGQKSIKRVTFQNLSTNTTTLSKIIFKINFCFVSGRGIAQQRQEKLEKKKTEQ